MLDKPGLSVSSAHSIRSRTSKLPGTATDSQRETTIVQTASLLRHQKEKVRLHLPCDQQPRRLIQTAARLNLLCVSMHESMLSHLAVTPACQGHR